MGVEIRRRQDSNLRGQSPVDFESTPLTAWVRLPAAGQMREPGIEPGPTPWQGAILPLDHSRLQSPCSLMDKALAS